MIVIPIVPIVLLGRRYGLSVWKIMALVLLYALYPAVSGGTFYDIHENCFLTFFILMAIWAIEEKKNVLMALFVILTFLVKEDAAIYLLVIGCFFLFQEKIKSAELFLWLYQQFILLLRLR
jgi:uncharacterized membrane protein